MARVLVFQVNRGVHQSSRDRHSKNQCLENNTRHIFDREVKSKLEGSKAMHIFDREMLATVPRRGITRQFGTVGRDPGKREGREWYPAPQSFYLLVCA